MFRVRVRVPASAQVPSGAACEIRDASDRPSTPADSRQPTADRRPPARPPTDPPKTIADLRVRPI